MNTLAIKIEKMSPKIENFLVWAVKIGIFLTILTPIILSKYTLFPALYGKSVYFRAVIEATAFFYVLLLFLTWSRKYLPKKSLVLLAILIYNGVLTLATIFSINPLRSFWGTIERMDGLIAHIHFLVFFIIIAGVLKSKKDWVAFLKAIVFFSVVIAGAAILQMAGKNYFFSAPKDPRISSTLGNPIFYAEYLVFIIFLSLILALIEKKKALKTGFWAILAVSFFLLLNTGTRSAWIGFGIGAMALFSYWLFFYGRQNKKIRQIAELAILSGLLVLLLFILLSQKGYLPDTLFYGRYQALWGILFNLKNARTVVWLLGLDAWTHAPILGHGLESFSYLYDKYYKADLVRIIPESIFFDRAHNKIVDVLAMTGLMGLISYLFIFVAAIYSLFKKRITRNASATTSKMLADAGGGNSFPYFVPLILTALLLAYFIQNVFGFDVITSYILFYAALAFIAVNFSNAENMEQNEQNNDKDFSGSKKWLHLRIPAAILVGFLIIFAGYQVNAANVSANFNIIKFYEVLSVNGGNGKTNPFLYLDKAYDTTSYTKFEVHYYGAESLVNTMNQTTDPVFRNAALAELKKTADFMERYLDGKKETLQERSYLLLAQAYKIIYLAENNKKYLDDEERLLKKAAGINPNFIQISRYMGELKFLQGNKAEGEKYFQKAYQADQDRANYYEWLGISLVESGDAKAGAEMLRKKVDSANFYTQGNFNINSIWRIVNIYQANKDYKNLIELLNEAISKYPGGSPAPQLYVSLAVGYFKNGDEKMFRQTLDRLAGKYPEYYQKVNEFKAQVAEDPGILK